MFICIQIRSLVIIQALSGSCRLIIYADNQIERQISLLRDSCVLCISMRAFKIIMTLSVPYENCLETYPINLKG